MNKKRPADALFSKTRGGILAATYGQPQRWWYLSELAEDLGTAPSSLQRELSTLVGSGLLRQRRDGNRIYFQAESESSIFDDLRSLLAKLSGVGDAIKITLKQFDDQISIAFIYGSVARHDDHALSDVDIIVIGSIGLAELSTPVRRIEKKFKREINLTCYSPAEFRRKALGRNHLLNSVLREEKFFLKGDANELEKLAGKSDRSNA